MTEAFNFAIMSVTLISTILGFVGAVVWWVQSGGKWMNDDFGRWIMTFLISGTTLAGAAFVNRAFGPWPGSLYVILAAWLGLCFAMSCPLFLWRRARREARNERRRS